VIQLHRNRSALVWTPIRFVNHRTYPLEFSQLFFHQPEAARLPNIAQCGDCDGRSF
jgi:hypothetical protein